MNRIRLALFSALAFVPPAAAQHTVRASVTEQGLGANGGAMDPNFSADGSVVVFASWASDIVPGDVNLVPDLFAHDLTTGQTSAISVNVAGTPVGAQPTEGLGNMTPVSADGRYVAFVSSADQIVPGPPPPFTAASQVYVRDRSTGTTVRVSRSPQGDPANAYCTGIVGMSDNGRFVAFAHAGATNLATNANLVLHDRDADGDGVFDETGAGEVSWTPGAVTGSGLPLTTGQYHTGVEVSDDGRYLVFAISFPGSPHQAWITDRDLDGDGVMGEPNDVATTQLIHNSGTVAIGNATPDMRYIAYAATTATWPYQPHVFDRLTGSSIRVSEFRCVAPTLSADGRYVAFYSANPLVPEDTNGMGDVYRYDRDTDEDGIFDEPSETAYQRVSVSSSGLGWGGGGHWLELQWISADGQRVAFASLRQLVPEDATAHADIFVHDAGLGVYIDTFCSPHTSSQDCTPHIEWGGSGGYASLSSPYAFEVRATQVDAQRAGVLLWGSASAPSPLAGPGGALCGAPPARKSAILGSGGTSGCSGTFSIDLNPLLQADPQMQVGTELYAQFWYHDPQDPLGAGWTDALQFTVCP